MRAGAKLNFGKAEVYWPQDDASNAQYQKLLGLTANPSAQDTSLVQPTFDAKVRIDAQIDVLVTPEVSFIPAHWKYSCTVSCLSLQMHDIKRIIWEWIAERFLLGQYGRQNWGVNHRWNGSG